MTGVFERLGTVADDAAQRIVPVPLLEARRRRQRHRRRAMAAAFGIAVAAVTVVAVLATQSHPRGTSVHVVAPPSTVRSRTPTSTRATVAVPDTNRGRQAPGPFPVTVSWSIPSAGILISPPTAGARPAAPAPIFPAVCSVAVCGVGWEQATSATVQYGLFTDSFNRATPQTRVLVYIVTLSGVPCPSGGVLRTVTSVTSKSSECHTYVFLNATTGKYLEASTGNS